MNYSKRNIIAIGILFILVSMFGVVMMKPDNITKRGSSVTQEEQVPPPSDSDHYKWRAPTPITIVNYFSPDCPHCRELFLDEEESLGLYSDVFSLIYRHSPLPLIQPLSFEKSVIAECVFRESGDDEKFFSFLKELFVGYERNTLNNEWVKTISKPYITDTGRFERCMVEEGKQVVEKSVEIGLAHEVYGTPTIVVFIDTEQVLRLNLASASAVIRLYDSLRLQDGAQGL